jgi:hypothetical protein
MKRMKIIPVLVFVLIPVAVFAQYPKLPVFYLKYNGAVGQEEDPYGEELEANAQRHTVSLRIKEQVSKVFVANVTTVYSRKEYFDQSGSYNYMYVYPDVTWSISDKLKWFNGFKVKWYLYDELDSGGDIKDYTSLQYKTNLTFKIIEDFEFIPLFEMLYELYENQEKSRQSYTLGIKLAYDFDGVELSGRYKAVLRWPMTEDTVVEKRLDHEFGVSVTWDPNG